MRSSAYAKPESALARYRVPLIGIVIAIVLLFILNLTVCSHPADLTTEPEPLEQAEPSGQRVTFVAVGDNLPEISIAAFADAQAGEVDDGAYDYRPIFAAIKPYIESADLAYINQETHIGGDEIGPRGYPSFNTTSQMADAVVDTGFDLVASASNHSYDWGYYGALNYSREVWNALPVVFTGTATSQEEADELALIERNGIVFALLDYTYGVNAYDPSEFAPYEINFIDEERITADVEQAKAAADVVLVAMHWGTEKQQEPDEQQQYYAQLLADLDVDVVLGSHTHTIGPLEWVEGKDGHKTLVAYSLGNFISNHSDLFVYNQIEGMLSCTFVRNKDDPEVRIEDVAWVPLINHVGDNGEFGVYALKDYTQELADAHVLLKTLEDPFGELRSITQDVIGEDMTIVWE